MQFKEVQRFNQWWVWAIILGAGFVLPLATLRSEVLKNGFPNDVFTDVEMFLSFAMPFIIGLILVVLFYNVRLETTVDETGVSYRFFPFHIKTRHKPWADVEQVFVRKYSPLGEFGGWGLRYGAKGMALNVRGDLGLQIVYKHKQKRLLIGTQKYAELEALLNSYYEQGLVKGANQ